MRAVDVAIVGGGPGGAAAAKCVRKASPNLSVKVFERASTLRRVGSIIALFPNGESAIEAVDPSCMAKIEALALPDGPAIFYDDDNKEILRRASIARENQGRVLPWYQLQHGLLEDLPAGTVELGHDLDELTVTDSGVELRFRDQDPVLARVVVGADGNMSKVRRAILDDGPPDYLNTGVWRGITPMPADWPHEEFLTTWFGAFASGLAFITKLSGGMLAWQVFAPWKAARLAELGSGRYIGDVGGDGSHSVRLQRCLDALSAKGRQPAHIMELIQSTDPSTVTEHGLFCRDPATCQVWGKGRVTLLGDAAHLGTPALGQGVNQALEDAVELGRAIGALGPTEAALREYERVRVPRATAVQAGSVEMTTRVVKGIRVKMEQEWHDENPWCRSLKVEPLVAPVRSAVA